ncbi:MAG: penicillin-binding protein [Lachnospiraceae bacterium]|nr:penicillin-binding protein [Lachnospiraceae bacterium]
MFEEIKARIVSFLTSRFLLPFIMLGLFMAVLISKIFSLQIVNGDYYRSNFTLSIEKQVSLPSTRGNIYDRNGVLLAYNELAYSVTITDTIESGSSKNRQLNDIIIKAVRIIEKHNDSIISDFGIYIDENDNYCFSYTGTKHQRFLADIYGKSMISDLSYEQRTANPDEVMSYLCSKSKYGVGTYSEKNGSTSGFMAMMGYSKKEMLDIVIIRYKMSLNAFQKYIATTIATDVSEETVAEIMENENLLQGVTIAEDTIRRYNHSVYFSQIIGYTGRISEEEYEEYSASDPNYSTNDYVGKTGIEYSMESELQGQKGSETLFVDNLGKILETENVVNPVAGNDIYLTIDSELQMAVYHLLEQKIAGILVSRIVEDKDISTTGRNKMISIYDIYYALISNHVIDLNHMDKPYAAENEKAVYEKFDAQRDVVIAELRNELTKENTVYSELPPEYQEYESFIVSMLSSDNYGVILSDRVDQTDEMYIRWHTAEDISLHEYLSYCISKQWVDLTKLTLEDRYSDSSEVYNALVEYIIEKLMTNSDFSVRIYKYLIRDDVVTGRELEMILWEQDVIQIEDEKLIALKNGDTTAYAFMVGLVSKLRITPAQLGLEPCSGSCVITDPNSGEVLALVSYPGYDNNKLANTADSAYLAKLTFDRSKPLWNYATQQKTAPGSTFKMVTSVAGVEEGVIDTGSIIECEGSFTKLTGIKHNCWIYPGSHGELSLSGAIQNSCNCYFYEVGYRLADDGTGYNDTYGMERIAKYAAEFGLGAPSGVEITESTPEISDQYPVASAIGQGTHNYTTAGLARYVSAVANRGTVYDLTLIHEIRNSSGVTTYTAKPKIRNQVILSPELWNTIHTGMKGVVSDKVYFNNIDMVCAGKTGTAQESANKPNHALFVGFAPANAPKIALAVRIANGYSSDFAAQMGCDVIKYYFDLEEHSDLITGNASDATATSAGD